MGITQIEGDPENLGDWIKIKSGQKSVKISSLNYQDSIVPNVYGMGLSDALYLLEYKHHLVVKFEGSGSVISQSLKAGSKITPDQTIIKLKLG